MKRSEQEESESLEPATHLQGFYSVFDAGEIPVVHGQ